jgi:hypothetical protein
LKDGAILQRKDGWRTGTRSTERVFHAISLLNIRRIPGPRTGSLSRPLTVRQRTFSVLFLSQLENDTARTCVAAGKF